MVAPAALPFDFSLLGYGAIFLLFILFVAGAVSYVRRTPGGTGPSATEPEGQDLPGGASGGAEIPLLDPVGQAPLPGPWTAPEGSLADRYAHALRSAGIGEATHAAYSEIAGRLARDHKIARHRVLTPREMAKTCRERPYCSAFASLVAAYERIRYGGFDTQPLREEFEASMELTDARMRGEDH